MPSLMEYYQAPQGTPAPFIQAMTAEQKGRAQTEAGLGQSRIQRNFSQRTLPQLASEEASAGRFYSTAAKRRGAFATEDVGDQVGDIQRRLGYTLADLTRSGVLAQLGVNV